MTAMTAHRTSADFWDKISAKYAKRPISDMAAYEEKLTRLGSLLSKTDNVLEIGCGTGSTALRLAPGVSHITGTDHSRGMIEIAKSKLGTDVPANITFHQAEADSHVTGQPFDAVCAFSLLHLVPDIPAVLDRVRKQLKPGGLFITKTGCLKDKTIVLRGLVAVLTAVGYAPPISVLSREDLVRQIKGAGFDVESVEYFGKDRMSPFIVARRTRD